ncbi:MAG: RNase adapter RapZ [Pseudomonadales bacterium]|nr:RNase adapter RapZ [Pseudomonadales bacterium]
MKLTIISGRSGSGKSTALNVLEDAGINCVDNIPVGLLPALVHNALRENQSKSRRMAVSIDARNSPHDLKLFPEILISIDRMQLDSEVIYLDALSPTLVKRFSETRRRHPLTTKDMDLREAIDAEGQLLENISDIADLTVDTTSMKPQELADLIRSRVIERVDSSMSLLFRSFGFKYGVPVDADQVFDIRCLPNPYWEHKLRQKTGQDKEVIAFLSKQSLVNEMYNDMQKYLRDWLPRFEENNRNYMTIAIGCTGGQHRSVYLANRLAQHFSKTSQNVLIRHRELNKP